MQSLIKMTVWGPFKHLLMNKIFENSNVLKISVQISNTYLAVNFMMSINI